MLKADAVDGIVQLNVHAQVIAVELEFVAGAQACVFIEVSSQCGHWALEAQFPMFVLAGVGLVINARCRHVCLLQIQGRLPRPRTELNEIKFLIDDMNHSACILTVKTYFAFFKKFFASRC